MWRFIRDHRGLTLVSVALVASLAINVAGMIRYRVLQHLWRPAVEMAELPLSGDLDTTPLTPRLAAPQMIESVEELRAWQVEGREKLGELLGVSLGTEVPPVKVVARETVGSVIRQTLIVTQMDGLEVPAFLLRPDDDLPRPALMVIPAHSVGIVATAGIHPDYQNSMALRLAEAGYVALTMEVRGFGYLHRSRGDFPFDNRAYTGYSLVRGDTRLGITIQDVTAGMNYLRTRKDVNGQMGLVGLSSGCDAAIYLGALDTSIEVVVASGCVKSHESNFLLSNNDPYEAVPGLAGWMEMSDCLGLLSPRPVLVQWGENDRDVAERTAAFNATSLEIYAAAKRIYESESAGDRIEKRITPGTRHEFDVEAAVGFLKRRFPADRRQPVQ